MTTYMCRKCKDLWSHGPTRDYIAEGWLCPGCLCDKIAKLEATKSGLRERIKGISNSVLEWWEDHEYDTTGKYGEYNMFDEDPEFVVMARSAKKEIQ